MTVIACTLIWVNFILINVGIDTLTPEQKAATLQKLQGKPAVAVCDSIQAQ